MISQMVETCNFGICDMPVDRFMNFCPGCGVAVSEECPFCNQSIRRKKEKVFSCPTCSAKVKYCSGCGRLYPVSTRYCRNNYCPSFASGQPLSGNPVFWQNCRGNNQYHGYGTYTGNGIAEIEDIREPGGILEIRNSTYPLVYGEYACWVADRYINIWSYGFPDGRVEKIPMSENPGDDYSGLFPVIVDGKLLLNERNNITFVNLEKDESGKYAKGRLFNDDLSSPVYSAIAFNEKENKLAFMTQDGTLYSVDFNKGEALIRWSIDLEKTIPDKNNKLPQPIFIGENIAFIKSDGDLCIINEQGAIVFTKPLKIKGNMIQHLMTAEEYLVMTIQDNNKILLYNTKAGELNEMEFESGKINHPPIYYKYRSSSKGFLIVTAGESFEIVYFTYPEQPPGKLVESTEDNIITTAPVLMAGQSERDETLDIIWAEKNRKGVYSLCSFSLKTGEKRNLRDFMEPVRSCIAPYDNNIFAITGNSMNIFTLAVSD
jgi:hypothetical protein